jgi:hypothetical protein
VAAGRPRALIRCGLRRTGLVAVVVCSRETIDPRITELGYSLTVHNPGVDMPSLHDFEAPSIKGEPIRLSEFEGQLCLVVNVASR